MLERNLMGNKNVTPRGPATSVTTISPTISSVPRTSFTVKNPDNSTPMTKRSAPPILSDFSETEIPADSTIGIIPRTPNNPMTSNHAVPTPSPSTNISIIASTPAMTVVSPTSAAPVASLTTTAPVAFPTNTVPVISPTTTAPVVLSPTTAVPIVVPATTVPVVSSATVTQVVSPTPVASVILPTTMASAPNAAGTAPVAASIPATSRISPTYTTNDFYDKSFNIISVLSPDVSATSPTTSIPGTPTETPIYPVSGAPVSSRTTHNKDRTAALISNDVSATTSPTKGLYQI